MSAWGFREWSWLVLMTATIALLIVAVIYHSAIVAATCGFWISRGINELPLGAK